LKHASSRLVVGFFSAIFFLFIMSFVSTSENHSVSFNKLAHQIKQNTKRADAHAAAKSSKNFGSMRRREATHSPSTPACLCSAAAFAINVSQ
jgi:hypothetical protein